jgi:hypothetical protein
MFSRFTILESICTQSPYLLQRMELRDRCASMACNPFVAAANAKATSSAVIVQSRQLVID